MSTDDSHEKQQRTVRKMLDDYAFGLRAFTDEKLIAVHQKNVRLRAEDLVEITRAELERRGLSPDS